MDAPKVRETSMVKGNSHVLWRSTHSKPHCTESDVRLKVPRSHSHPLQKGLSAVFQRSECAGFRYKEPAMKELERQHSLSRTSRPQRDTARAFGPKPVQPKPIRNCAATVPEAKPK